MIAKDLGFEELYGLGDIDALLEKAQEKCELKLRGKKFAGMEKEDVVQEVLIKVHKSLSKYDSSKAKMSTYIEHVIENMVKDCYKKCGTEKNLILVNALELEDSYEWDDEAFQGYGAHVGSVDAGYMAVDMSIDVSITFSAREKEIFELRTQGYEFVDIADKLGVTKARISQIWKGIKAKYDQF
ncbi:sigma-70 family RNA polymerase sigma factor [Peribacillus frigoritolerans]|uniref:Sigma-70 family RNA polymerase sigma factor n=1 Tax=Peribacillus castrilensis TaxID=2897690 RepID=A0AAW9NLG5_9BACI|nr:sigma-70 family RNA polymerase sigma factor [Peribacillus castrilensis]